MDTKEANQTRPLLIIDDEPDLCEMVRLVLTTAGFKVISAPDGLSGIKLAQAAEPAVILLDIIMPGLDGVSTCQFFKQDPTLRSIPVVGITASPDLRYTEQAFRVGAEFFLAKPFGRESLLQVVNLALQRTQRQPGIRSHPRYSVELPARCLVPREMDAAQEIMGHTGNVSFDGLLLWLPETLATGVVFRFQLRLTEGMVTGNGTVIWQGEGVNNQIIPHGVQLLGFVGETDLVQYTRYLGQIAAGSAA